MAAGGILVMLADTMIPEAFDNRHRLATRNNIVISYRDVRMGSAM